MKLHKSIILISLFIGLAFHGHAQLEITNPSTPSKKVKGETKKNVDDGKVDVRFFWSGNTRVKIRIDKIEEAFEPNDTKLIRVKPDELLGLYIETPAKKYNANEFLKVDDSGGEVVVALKNDIVTFTYTSGDELIEKLEAQKEQKLKADLAKQLESEGDNLFNLGRYEEAETSFFRSNSIIASTVIYSKYERAKAKRIEFEKARDLVSEGDEYFKKSDFIKAKEMYSKYLNSQNDPDVSIKLDKTVRRISDQYNKFVQAANSAFNKSAYSDVLSNLESAKVYQTLTSKEQELEKKAKYHFFMAEGEGKMNNESFFDAKESFKKAEAFAYNSEKINEIQGKINSASQIPYDKYLTLARRDLENGLYESALQNVNSAKRHKQLDYADTQLEIKIYQKADEAEWKKAEQLNTMQSYEYYIKNVKDGSYLSQAKNNLANLYESSGDSYYLQHKYVDAQNQYQKSLKLVNNPEIEKKYKKMSIIVKRTAQKLDLGFGLPVGFNSTKLVTRDHYAYSYVTNKGTYPDEGYGHNERSSTGFIVPLSAEINYRFPIKISGAPPIVSIIGLSFSTYKAYNTNNVTAQDYDVYSTFYVPQNATIRSIDTLSKELFINALSYQKIGAKIGIRPLPYFTLYFPLQSVKVNYQPNASCIDCGEESSEKHSKIETGRFALGLGLEFNYDLGERLNVLVFWENWNSHFNFDEITNVTWDDSKAGGSIFSPIAYSRNLGAQIGYSFNEMLSASIRYENPVMNGDFTLPTNTQMSLRRFSQNIIQIRLNLQLNK